MKQIAGIVKTETQNRKAIYKVLKMDKIPDGTKVLLAFLGHPRFVTMFKKDHPTSEVEVLENKDLAWLYDGLDYEAKLVDPVNINEIKEILKDMKFDYIIMNPPYNGNLHLKILEEAMKHSDNVVNLSPVRWMQDPFKEYKKNSDYKKYGPTILPRVENLKIVTTAEALELFNIQVSDLGIYTIKKETQSPISTQNNSLLEKITKFCFSHQISYDLNKKDSWRVKWPIVSSRGGHGWTKKNAPGEGNLLKLKYFYEGTKDGKPWYEYFTRNQFSKTTPEITYSVKFNSEEEAKNFCKSFHTKFSLFCQENFIIDINIYTYSIPWMGDQINPRTGLKGYESEWTDEDFYKFFDLTDDEIKIIEDTMAKYK